MLLLQVLSITELKVEGPATIDKKRAEEIEDSTMQTTNIIDEEADFEDPYS